MRYEEIFDPIKTPREDASNLPPRDEIDAYLSRVRAEALDYLETPEGSADWQTFHLVLEHEIQHQETLLFLLYLLDPSTKRPVGRLRLPRDFSSSNVHPGTVEVPAGPFEMGSRGYPFAYDNEQPPHTVDLPAFRIDRYPVTNAQFADFVDGGGYSAREHWSVDGWAWLEGAQVAHPYSWIAGRQWQVRSLFESRALDPNEPVWGVSWYEADAYARWAGRRLPTEAEWEKAARGPEGRRFAWGDESPRAGLGNFDWLVGHETPVGAYASGASPHGCYDLTGNVWEWTSSEFAPYPGFHAFPYPEYSEVWFDGDHRVCRGGSWATRGSVLRTSFRNFYRRNFRIGFVGFRLAD